MFESIHFHAALPGPLGAAAVWRREYRLKPWDVCAGVLIATEAGAKVTTMEGGDYSVFDRSVLATTPSLHAVTLPPRCDEAAAPL